jgi:hypothetical protein
MKRGNDIEPVVAKSFSSLYFGGLGGTEGVRGTFYVSEEGLQFVWQDQNRQGVPFRGAPDQQVWVRRDDIAETAVETDRRPSVGATVLFGVWGLAARQTRCVLLVTTSDGRVGSFVLPNVEAAAVIGALATFGCFRRLQRW